MGADGNNAVGQTAGGHHRGLLAQLGLHAVDHAVQQQGGTQNAAAFHAVHGVGADGVGRGIQRDGGQQRRVGRQRRQGQLHAGDDGPAAERTLAIQYGDGGGGAHVDEDQGRLIHVQRAHGGHQQVAGQRGGVVQTDRQVGADAGTYHHGLHTGQHFHGFRQGAGDLGDHRGDNGAVKGVRRDMAELQQAADGDGVFRAGGEPVGGHAAQIADAPALHAAQDDMGVANIQREDHSALPHFPFCTAVRRAASLPLLNTTALAMTAPVKKHTMASTRPLTPTKAMTNRKALALPIACTKP